LFKKEEEKKPILSTDFSIPSFLVVVMASSSSNPSPSLVSAMVVSGDPQNPMADTEITDGAGTRDGVAVDPSRFSPVLEGNKESFAFPLFDP
jgi:hypothetical protein